MKKLLVAVSCFLLVGSAFAGGPVPTPSVASLNGTYSFNIGSPQDTQVSASITCTDPFGNPFQVTGISSSGVKPNVIDGVATFDGAGNVSITATDYGELDSASSVTAILATLTCSGQTSIPKSVFFPPTALTATGTYSIASDGTGTMTLSITSGGTGNGPGTVNLILRLGGLSSKQPATTILLHTLRADNAVDSFGTAVLI